MKSDVDPQETREWQDAIEGVIDHEGRNALISSSSR